MIKNFRQ